MALKDIKSKIQSVNRTHQVTKAMEAVSAVKMRKSQARAFSGRPYARSALSILERLAPSLASVKHPLTEKRTEKHSAFIVVTSDKGLAGVLNAAVLKETSRRLEALTIPKDAVDIFAFGKKAAEYFERRGYTLKDRFENISDDVSIEDMERTAQTIVNGFTVGMYDRVDIVYTNFKSTFEQQPVWRRVLPLSSGALHDIVVGIVPEKGMFARPGNGESPSFYTTEPSSEEVLDVLLPRLTSVILYHALLESKASEHSARMVAMKNASDKSRDLSKSLLRTFNKVRQAAITSEVSEIVGGIEAMASK